MTGAADLIADAAPRKPRELQHRWMKFGTGKVVHACLECGLVKQVVGTSGHEMKIPIISYRRGDLDFGVQRKQPPCAPLFQAPVVIVAEGYRIEVKRDLGKDDLKLREKFRK